MFYIINIVATYIGKKYTGISQHKEICMYVYFETKSKYKIFYEYKYLGVLGRWQKIS